LVMRTLTSPRKYVQLRQVFEFFCPSVNPETRGLYWFEA